MLILGTLKGRREASDLGVFEVNQNVELLAVMAEQTKKIEAMLRRKYGKIKPVELLMTIPGVGFLSALTLYAEICDIKRFSSAEKLAHYAGLVPRVSQSGEHSFAGKEARGDCWLKCIFIEFAWSHLRFCPEGHLSSRCLGMLVLGKAIVKDAIKIVARKLVNVVWAVWTYEREFTVK